MQHEHRAMQPESDDIMRARRVSPYSTREKVARLFWGAVQGSLFRFSFHNWYGFRRALLRAFGARMHATANVRRSVTIECPWNLSIGAESSVGDRAVLYCLGPVSIGARVTVSQGAHLCAGTHDSEDPAFTLHTRPIIVGARAWVAAEAFVGPGVTVGEGAVLGARGCAFADLAPWTVYRGNPAAAIRARTIRFVEAA